MNLPQPPPQIGVQRQELLRAADRQQESGTIDRSIAGGRRCLSEGGQDDTITDVKVGLVLLE